jgi:2-hydroxychromene-2-carboxylate isomerase
MTERTLSFHFDFISPYSYLAWHQLKAFAPKHGLRIEVKPTLLAGLLDHFGHKGPGEIPPKQSYIFKDCTRAAAALGIPFEPPASHPFHPLASLRATLLDTDEGVRQDLVTRLFDATWAESLDVGSPEVVAELASGVGVPDVLTRIQDPVIKKKLLRLGAEAIELGVFGVPTMIIDGELFWGTDSFPHLERFLAGQDPVRPQDAARWAAVKPSAQR